VQVESACFWLLRLKHDRLPSCFAFDIELRPKTQAGENLSAADFKVDDARCQGAVLQEMLSIHILRQSLRR
jgi:hypothetical protein